MYTAANIKVLLELLTTYGQLVDALNVTYYVQDTDEIHRLEALAEQLEAQAGITWTKDGAQWAPPREVPPHV